MELNDLITFISNNTVAIGVLIYLLWERTKFNETITSALKELKDTTQLIKDYFLKCDNDNK